MRFFEVVAVAMCISLVAPSARSDEGVSKRQCNMHGDEAEANNCILKELSDAEGELNAIYSKLIESLVDSQPFEQSQQAWSKYLDAECSPGMIVVTRSVGAYGRAACRLKLVYRRIDDLKWHDAQDCNGCPERKKVNHAP